MTTITLPVRPHDKQTDIINSPSRYIVNAAGRRFGKTEAHRIRAIYCVLRNQRVWWLTPTYSAGTDTWRTFLSVFRTMPGVNMNKSERRIVLPTGGELRMVSADSFKRGAGIHRVFIDEAAFCPDTLWQYELRPMLLENKGGADFLSSTNGRNWFWTLYQLGLDPSESEWESWHFTSYDNPRLDKNEIDDIRRNTPERVFSQEYMAEFLDDGGAVFRNLKACIIDNPQRRGDVVFGVDFARVDDYTVIVAIDTKTHQVLEIDRFNQIDWTLQRGRIAAMASRWGPTIIYAEANSIGEPNIEELQKQGLTVRGFTTTSSSKPQIINALALAFEQTDIGIPDDPVLLGELQAYSVERLPSGTFRYSAPSGLHDDMVMALALAWHGVTNVPGTKMIEIPDLFGR